MSVLYVFSRGCLTYWISSSSSILDCVPLNETAIARSVLLFPWVRTWIGVNNIENLTPENWFEEGLGFKGASCIV